MSSLKSKKSSKDTKTPDIDKKELEPRGSFANLKSLDLSRHQFSYFILASLSWWPEEIVIFLEALNSSYNDFINHYLNNASSFDSAIKRAVYLMLDKKYQKIQEIKRFSAVCGNFKIVDDYLVKMMTESNCHMYENREHKRSPDEDKHAQLAEAIRGFVALIPTIKEQDQKPGNDEERLLHVYSGVYILKTLYARFDNDMRSLLLAALDGHVTDLSVRSLTKNLLKEIDISLLTPLRNHYDAVLLNKVCLFRDMVMFAAYSAELFSYVFCFTRNVGVSSSEASKLIPQLPTPSVVERLEKVYRFYLLRTREKNIKQEAVVRHEDKDFEKLIAESEKAATNLDTPRYCREDAYIEPPSMGTKNKIKKLSRVRKASQDSPSSLSGHSAREDTYTISETGTSDRSSSVKVPESKSGSTISTSHSSVDVPKIDE